MLNFEKYKNTKKHKQYYETIKDDQEYFDINVYSGKNKYCKDNELLTHFIIDKLPKGPAHTVKLIITFGIDRNGILTIDSEVSSGSRRTVQYSLYEEEVQDKKNKFKSSIKNEEKKQVRRN